MPENRPKSVCCVCGELVTTNKYAQVIPMVEVAVDADGNYPKTSCKIDASGKVYDTPAPDNPVRVAGKQWVCLFHDVDEITRHVDVSGAALYEVRHKPPRGIFAVAAADIKSKGRITVLKNGRRCVFDRFEESMIDTETGEPTEAKEYYDFGIGNHVRCMPEDVVSHITKFRDLLREQLLR